MASQNLILLGLLMDGPRYGYELKQKIQTSLTDVGAITPGTIYYTLRSLEQKGWATSRREKAGARPERIVYEITDPGRDVFRSLLEESLTTSERPYFLFDVGLYFARYLPPEFLEQAVNTKLQELRAHQQHASELAETDSGRWPFQLRAIRQRWKLIMDAHEQWYEDLLHTIRDQQTDQET